MKQRKYRVGIDVGLNSTGLAAIEVDKNGRPIKLLNLQVKIHDGGVDPTKNENGESRLAVSGKARRTRRMRARRRKRLNDLDKLISTEPYNYPLVDTNDLGYAFEPWYVRAELADAYIEDEVERKQKLSIALRHIARHRGWRNPYHQLESLLDSPKYSEHYEKLLENVREKTGNPALSGTLTPAQLVREAIEATDNPDALRLRTRVERNGNKEKETPGVLPRKLFQQDNAKELLQIFTTQRLTEEDWKPLFEKVFAAKSPKGSAKERVGKDPLDPKEPRALKASLAFQKYRILNILTNLRIDEGGERRVLTVGERQNLFEILCESWGKSSDDRDDHTWVDVADILGLERRQLKGVGQLTRDGEERVTSRPPTLTTLNRIYKANVKSALRKSLESWWDKAGEADQEAMIKLLSNTVDIDAVCEDIEFAQALTWIDALSDEQLADLDKIVLPPGRAAYSEKTLRRLTERMLTTEDDLHAARKAVFGIDDNWRPPATKIGEPIGNPAVDRVLKIVNRFLLNCEERWGKPLTVQIEHVREGFASAATARKNAKELEKRNAKRKEERQGYLEKLRELGSESLDESAIRKIEAIQRQNCECLYCGREIKFNTAEMDHIVPRAGAGSTNTRTNLAAVCGECNQAKGRLPFAVWCKMPSAENRGVSLKDAEQRVKYFLLESGFYNAKAKKKFQQDVIVRLKRTEADPEIDNRSIESVAWMADELHRRIEWHYNRGKHSGCAGDDAERDIQGTKVWVFRGVVTASARRASGIENQINFIGGSQKTRFDRRHHAIDAAVTAMMTHGVARTLAVREQMRKSQKFVGRKPGEVEWKEYPNNPDTDAYRTFDTWKRQMQDDLLPLLNDALAQDRVPVLQNVRARFGSSIAHDATIKRLRKLPLGGEIDAETIRHASTPALYCALTRLPDYDREKGLSSDPRRTIQVNGTRYRAADLVAFFEGSSAQIMVQHGSADIGSTIHHARFYRCWQVLKSGKRKEFYGMVRVFQVDLSRYRDKDLFTAPLLEHSVSMRYAERTVAQAVLAGEAEYLGYLIVGDEILFDENFIRANQSGKAVSSEAGIFCNFMKKQLESPDGAILRWRMDGFYTRKQLRLRPVYLSREGLDNLAKKVEVPAEVEKILRRGYLPAVNVLAAYSPQVIRRNALGEPRFVSKHGLPVSWSWRRSDLGRSSDQE